MMYRFDDMMKWAILTLSGLTVFSCGDTSTTPKSTTPGNHDAEREVVSKKMTPKEALEKATAILSAQQKEVAEKLKVIDCGDYYTVTPDLAPFTLGGGWSVDVHGDSGEILNIYFTE